jgi:hypothetical protein
MNNFLAKPIMDAWMRPFYDLGMTHSILIPSQDIGSDHTEFEELGLPMFPFLQDPVENDSITFHSDMDFYDKIIFEYLIQGAVVVASFVYHAAMRDKILPRINAHVDKLSSRRYIDKYKADTQILGGLNGKNQDQGFTER